MSGQRLGFGLAVAVIVAVVVLIATCSDDAAKSTTASSEERSSPAPRPRVAPRRASDRRAAGSSARLDADASPDGAAGTVATNPSASKGQVRVRVTREGSPVEGAAIWLLPIAPGEVAPDVPVTQWSDGAYFGAPRHLGFAERFASSHDAALVRFGGAAGRTDTDGAVELPAPAASAVAVLAVVNERELIAGDLPVVRTADGETVQAALSVRPSATIAGHCLDDDGSPVGGAMVQAFDAREERAASALVRTEADGAFSLTVDASRPSVRVRAAAPRNLPMCDTESALPPVLGDSLVEGVAPGGPPLEVRLRRESGVVLELTSDIPFGHLQVEELAFDAAGQVWGRLGGPVYTRDVGKSADPKRAFVALSRADVLRPLMLWTWGGPPELTGVDPRGRTRVTARFARGRRMTVTGKGWLAGDRVRVVCRIGPAGEEFPGVWVENDVAPGGSWSRDDTPPCEVEVRLVRGGREIGPRQRVAAGSEDATVRLDL